MLQMSCFLYSIMQGIARGHADIQKLIYSYEVNFRRNPRLWSMTIMMYQEKVKESV